MLIGTRLKKLCFLRCILILKKKQEKEKRKKRVLFGLVGPNDVEDTSSDEDEDATEEAQLLPVAGERAPK
jgi:hypothetical protein